MIKKVPALKYVAPFGLGAAEITELSKGGMVKHLIRDGSETTIYLILNHENYSVKHITEWLENWEANKMEEMKEMEDA